MKKWIGLMIIITVVLCLSAGYFVFLSKRAGTTYIGILPGADCAGLKTELSLYDNGLYFLKETYLATRDGDKTYTSFGKWRKISHKGREIIQLDYDKPEKIYNFMVIDDNQILVIDKKLNKINCPMNLTLCRKKK